MWPEVLTVVIQNLKCWHPHAVAVKLMSKVVVSNSSPSYLYPTFFLAHPSTYLVYSLVYVVHILSVVYWFLVCFPSFEAVFPMPRGLPGT